jgi:hypothetical protein
MIEVFDETLRELVRREVVNGSQVEIAFDAPTKEWAARRNAPVVNLYLYDIRDDVNLREVQFEEVRDPTGRVIERRPPVRRFRLSYMVTAWTQRPEDEHRLLSACLATFLRHETLAPRELTGTLAQQPHHVEISIAMPPTEDRSIADTWTALGGELKPSLDLVATVPFVVDQKTIAGPPVLEEPRVRISAGAGSTERGASSGRPRAASVSESQRAAAPGTSAPGTSAPVAEETVVGGSDSQRGRIIHVRNVKRQ